MRVVAAAQVNGHVLLDETGAEFFNALAVDAEVAVAQARRKRAGRK
jgi:hypothetical protein